MSGSGGTLILAPEHDAVGRKRKDEPKARGRARDTGAVIALGVEISSELHKKFEDVRAARQWSKRVLVENALRHYFAHLDRAGD